MASLCCLNDVHGADFHAIHGDCVSVASQMPDNSIDFSIYSPPFAAIFVYSPSECDMGNCASDEEFRQHYQFLVNEKFRITKAGRLSAVHCSDLPMTKWKDGEIGLKDFMGDIIEAHKKAGWVLHSRVTIWRDPVVEMTRTKALGLLYKQVTKDSTRSRVGMPDYLCVFRKPGENGSPVFHPKTQFPVEQWQKLASPVWMDIRQTRTLNSSSETGIALSKDPESERHLCPLQLDVIENALFLWSNPGDIVFSPFMGIGSEGAMSLKHGRKFIGTELKEAYWRQACKHLGSHADSAQTLFSSAAA
jgi:DNA modification methylase